MSQNGLSIDPVVLEITSYIMQGYQNIPYILHMEACTLSAAGWSNYGNIRTCLARHTCGLAEYQKQDRWKVLLMCDVFIQGH